jgi:Putative MetA-pathway of phenol degradation
MFHRNTAIRFALLFAVLAIVVVRSEAQSGYRKTLLQWSYGTSFEGGPDVYEPLITDRPDFTESSVTVGYSVVQLETGYTFTHDSENGDTTDSHSFPESLLRIGAFAEWFEFRIDWNFVEEHTDIGGVEDTFSGAEDLGLGMKLALTPQERLLPETAIIFQMTVPSGSSEFTADEVLPGFNYLYGWDINDAWSTGGSTAVNRAVDEVTGDSYVELAQSWTVGHSWTDRIGSYLEWFVIAPSSADTTETEHYFNGGSTVLLNDDIQWDIRAGLGLNDSADDFFTGTGLSLRYW